ncbi:hypothetical protein [Moraxella lacunata]|uniref:hypothetical protein n=1 Tax=Moraxella lacunata TaxID=477 RepID=UPI003EE14065
MSSLGAKRKTDKRVGLLYLVLDIQGACCTRPLVHFEIKQLYFIAHLKHYEFQIILNCDLYIFD